MTIRVALEHTTSYSFDRPVKAWPHLIRLRPAPHSRTPIDAYSLTIEPRNHFVNWQQDPFGNFVARVVFPESITHLSISVDLVADMSVINPFDFFVDESAETFPFVYDEATASDLEAYLRPVPDLGPAVHEFVAANRPVEGTKIVDALVALNTAVYSALDYTVRLETGVQSPDETLAKRLGSCRDFAWLLVAMAREMGLAARFVSGYLVQLVHDITPVDGPAGPTADFTDLHAWAEIYIPGAGWVGLDATSGLLAGEGHIPLSATPSPATAAPITGATAPCEVTFDFSNTVQRIHEDARVTKPYGDAEWVKVNDLGRALDGYLQQADVRLTMGGEPTFVAAGDSSQAEWNTEADGPIKRRLATALAGRLTQRWAPQGVVHHGQGKWYPGEPLPRWQIGLFWRTDGQPLWREHALLDDPWGPPVVEPGSAASAQAVADFSRALAAELGVPDECLVPAFEDPLLDLLAEANQPEGEAVTTDLDPTDEALRGAPARAARLTSVQGEVGAPAGWVIPLFATPDGSGWGTTHWRTRRSHLFATAGSSPLGLRLPLGSIAWSGAPIVPEGHRFSSPGPLPAGSAAASPAQVLPIDEAPRTALTVQEREGHLCVFLPPLEEVEQGVALLSALENVATRLGQAIVLEGYPPPTDERIPSISVTPDPGVIEVNVQPTSSWDELVTLTETLFEDARQVGLATEKFDLDGTHTGTGGGNHITLGGTSPADSPLLRRPDLLRSLITFWQHHPSLSYVFSGRFIGPTSQAPRVDESRAESLHELQIAFSQLDHVVAMSHDVHAIEEPVDEEGQVIKQTRPWLTDRLLRHLLTDLTGNTHRAEFCIDKLFSPDSERGRLGLLELRGFEMPPHGRLSLAQALLVRALVARFWDEPYSGPLVRWGTRLHDRFLLPAFAAADLRDVIESTNVWLRGKGLGQLEMAWYESFLEFRFPRLGEVDVAGVHLELRGAVEPWQVLGEEVHTGGTSRYVDSSVERVQIGATGLIEGRHVVTANGVPVPMISLAGGSWGTGSAAAAGEGTRVGGVRFRAWAPPSALHPTIGIHAPLVIDVVDTWNGRSLGGFTHHVTHPGGLAYEHAPVNAETAEARRKSRFVPHGHSPASRLTPEQVATLTAATGAAAQPSGEYPTTLDLRLHPGTDHPPPPEGAPTD